MLLLLVQVPAHKAAIQQHGPCPEHRRSFEPVKSMTGWAGYRQKAKAAAATAEAAEAAAAAVQHVAAEEAEGAAVAVNEEAYTSEQQQVEQPAAGEVDAAAAVPDQGLDRQAKGSKKAVPQQRKRQAKHVGKLSSSSAVDEGAAAASAGAGAAGRKRRRA
jgi:hypothetical protein